MPKFMVWGGHDAFARYCTVIEAESEAEARQIAKDNDDLDWQPTGETTEFDDFEVFWEDDVVEVSDEEAADLAEPVQTYALTGPERDIILAALRLWQRSTNIPSELFELAENGRQRFLTDGDIDALIEGKINV